VTIVSPRARHSHALDELISGAIAMPTQTKDRSSSPHPTPQRLMQFAWGFGSTAVLASAVELGIFTHVAAGKTTRSALASATKASRRGLDMLLDALVGLGLLAREGASDTGEFRLAPGYIGDFILFHARMPYEGWGQLTESVRTGLPFRAVDVPENGAELWDKLVDSLFTLGYPAARELGQEIARLHPQGEIKVLDVAAGSGVWGIGAAETEPRVRVTALDLEATLPHTRRFVREHRLDERFAYVAGDLRELDFGAQKYDAAILGHICHSEGVEHTQELFAKLARALKPGATLAIAEFVPDADRRGPPLPLLFAINMLVHTSEGGTYTLPEFESWLGKAGFRDCRTLAVSAPSPLILATR
jgi:ubiquinone/menaquinone biosynthesis C-methylase UbiE